MQKKTKKNFLNFFTQNHEGETQKLILYMAIWQACVVASTREWPLLLLGLGTTLVITAPKYWCEARKWWFDINNWLIAIFLSLLYTMIRHNVELNSMVFFAKRTILISIVALSLNYILNDEANEDPELEEHRYSRLKRKLTYITSQICISLLVVAPFIANEGSGANQFDAFLGLKGASQVTALIVLTTAAFLPLAKKANQRNFAIYSLFTITSTLIFSGAQSRMTAGVMLTSMVYIVGYINKAKVVEMLGKTVTRLWIIYYAVFLPICAIAAPIIHDKAKWFAKVLYTATGSRYTMTWSANLWHENGLNFFNNNTASSIFGFLSNKYFDTEFTSLYGSASDVWNHGADVFVPGGAHSIYISILLKSQSPTFSLGATWAVLTLTIILLIKEYKSTVKTNNLSSNTTISLEIFIALMLSVLSAESVSLPLILVALWTYLLLLKSDSQARRERKGEDIKKKIMFRCPDRDNILSLTSPVIIVTPLILYGAAYLSAKMGLFANILKLYQ